MVRHVVHWQADNIGSCLHTHSSGGRSKMVVKLDLLIDYKILKMNIALVNIL